MANLPGKTLPLFLSLVTPLRPFHGLSTTDLESGSEAEAGLAVESTPVQRKEATPEYMQETIPEHKAIDGYINDEVFLPG